MILFIDEYVSVGRQKQDMDEVSFVETSSVLDETKISMNVSIGVADGGPDEDMLTPDSPDTETLGSSKPVQPDLPPAETSGHSQQQKPSTRIHSPVAEASGSSRPKPGQSCEVFTYSTTPRGNMDRHEWPVHSQDKHSCDTCSREYDLVENTVHRRDLHREARALHEIQGLSHVLYK